MGYASLAKGYKAGGVNSLQIGSDFDNEDVWNFETGIKQAFPDLRLAYNASAFYYVYDTRPAVRLSITTSIPLSVVAPSALQAYCLAFDPLCPPPARLALPFHPSYIPPPSHASITPHSLPFTSPPPPLPPPHPAPGRAP